MSQGDLGTLVAAETSGTDLAARLRSWRDAVHSMHSGASRPSYLQAGGEWLDTSVTPWIKKLWTGTVDVDVMSINPATGVTQSLIGLQENAGRYVYIAGGQIVTGERILRANGATLNRADFPHLFAKALARGLAASEGAKTAVQFGPGNGSTTFSLPDARGYFLRAFDDGRGIDIDRVLTAIQLAQTQGHAHEMNMGWDSGGNGYLWNDANGLPVYGSRSLSGSRSLFSKGAAEAGGLRVGKTGPATDLTGETRPINLAAVLGITY